MARVPLIDPDQHPSSSRSSPRSAAAARHRDHVYKSCCTRRRSPKCGSNLINAGVEGRLDGRLRSRDHPGRSSQSLQLCGQAARAALGVAEGLTQPSAKRSPTGARSPFFDARERAALAFAELDPQRGGSAMTYSRRCAAISTSDQIVELTVLTGTYNMLPHVPGAQDRSADLKR